MALYYSKGLSVLLSGVATKDYGDFFCLSCLDLFRTKYKLESRKIYMKIKFLCDVVIPFEDTKTLSSIDTKRLIKDYSLFTFNQKKWINVKTSFQNHLQQKQVNILYQFLQCPQYCHLQK